MAILETTLRDYSLAVDAEPGAALRRIDGGTYSGTLSGATTITNAYPRRCKLDPGGASRNVTVEAEAASYGIERVFINTADAAENLVFLDDTPATIGTARAGERITLYCDGTTWRVTRVDAAREPMVGASTAAAGTTTTDAGVLPAGTSPAYPTSAADGTKGVRIHANDSVPGRIIEVANWAAAVLKVYPATGGTINGGSVDASVSSVSGHGVRLMCTAALTWIVLN